MVFGLESEPERLSPLTIQNPQTFRVAWQIYEGLLGLSPEGEIQPRLAESWQTRDYQTWTFTLRSKVTFHRSDLFGNAGTRGVTSDDVVWSYNAFCSPGAYASFVLADSLAGCADYNSGKASSVSGVRALDGRTIELKLLKPEPFFINRITTAWIAVFPRESGEPAFKDRWGLDAAVGTGPFRLVSRSDTEIVLERNDAYWDRSRVPAVAKVIFRVLKNDQVRLAELSRGSIDVMTVSPQLVPSLVDPPGGLKPPFDAQLALKVVPTFNHHLIGFNLTAVRDVHLRRAISLGTNRREIADRLRFGYADVTGGPVPPAMAGYRSAIPEPLFNADMARQELKQSTYKGESLELLVHDLASSEQIGAAFQQQMKAIGVNVRLTKLDFGSVIGRIIKGDAALFSMFAEIVFSSPEPLLLNLFSTTKIPVPNFWKYSNPSVDSALESLRTISSRDARLVNSAEIERNVVADAPAIFLFSARDLIVHSKRIISLPVNAHEHFQLEAVQLSR